MHPAYRKPDTYAHREPARPVKQNNPAERSGKAANTGPSLRQYHNLITPMASNTLPRGGVHHPALSSRAHAPTQSANIRPAQAQNVHIPHTSTSQSSIPPKRAVDALLPTCTIGRPLTETQVVNLSDMAGSLREVMLLAMRAKMDGSVMTELEGALGEAAAQGVVQFFENEFEF